MKLYRLIKHTNYEVKSDKFDKSILDELKEHNIVLKEQYTIMLTTCVLFDENKNIKALGYGVQRLGDNYFRKRANEIAYGRALKAFYKRKNISPVRDRYNTSLRLLQEQHTLPEFCWGIPVFKGYFLPTISKVASFGNYNQFIGEELTELLTKKRLEKEKPMLEI